MNTDIKSLSLKAAAALFTGNQDKTESAAIIERVFGPLQTECKEYADLLAAAEEKLDSANRDRGQKRKRALRAEERANQAEARIVELEAENARLVGTIANISATFEPVRAWYYEKANEGDYENCPDMAIVRCVAAIQEPHEDMKALPTAEKLAELYKSERDDFWNQLFALQQEREAIRTLSTAETMEAEALVERLFVASGMLAEEPPLIAFARIKLELQRLRMSVFFARNLIQSLQDPECVGCGAEAGAACKNDCQLWDWMEKRGEVLHAHRLIPPFPAAVATQEE